MAMADDFLRESNRLKSFTIFDWPLKRNMHAKALAKAGFYYYGEADRVQCAFCNGILGDWEEEDLPMHQHRKYFPNCIFLRNPYGCGNIALIERSPSAHHRVNMPFPVDSSRSDENAGTHREKSLPNNAIKKKLSFKLPHDDEAEVVVNERGSRFTYRPFHPEMADFEKRLKSFRKYSKFPLIYSTPLPAEHLADAGFFYSGPEDVVCCFFCNGTLSRWLPGDDAWAEHAKWYPRCIHLQLVKGPDFVNELTRKWTRPHGSKFSSLPSGGSPLSEEVSKVDHLYQYEGGHNSRVSHL